MWCQRFVDFMLCAFCKLMLCDTNRLKTRKGVGKGRGGVGVLSVCREVWTLSVEYLFTNDSEWTYQTSGNCSTIWTSVRGKKITARGSPGPVWATLIWWFTCKTGREKQESFT